MPAPIVSSSVSEGSRRRLHPVAAHGLVAAVGVMAWAMLLAALL